MQALRKFLISMSILFVGVSGPASFAKGSIAIDVELTPVGSFTAHADTLRAFALKKGDSYIAQNIKFKIADLKTGIELRDQHMKEKYFEVGTYPTADLIIAQGKGGKFKAKLKIHGKTRVIVGTYEVLKSRLKAKFKTGLSNWNIAEANYMGVGVVDEVAVTVEIPIK